MVGSRVILWSLSVESIIELLDSFPAIYRGRKNNSHFLAIFHDPVWAEEGYKVESDLSLYSLIQKIKRYPLTKPHYRLAIFHKPSSDRDCFEILEIRNGSFATAGNITYRARTKGGGIKCGTIEKPSFQVFSRPELDFMFDQDLYSL